MSVQSKFITLSFLSTALFMLLVLPVISGSAESIKTRKADLEAQSAEIKKDATVAMDISLNALSNVMATFNDTEKVITAKLQTGNIYDVRSMVEHLAEVWKSEKDVLEKIEKISKYVTMATSTLDNVEIQLENISESLNNKSSFKKADKAASSARKNINKATAIAEKLKQTWLVPIKNEEPKKK